MNRLALAVLCSSLACPALAQSATPAPAQPAAPTQPAQPAAKPAAKPAANPTAVKTQPAAKEPAKPLSPEAQAQLDAMTKAGEPGAQHKHIEQFAGQWYTLVKQFSPDGAVQSEDKGSTVCKMVMGGRFLQSEYEGRFMGSPTRGGGLMGFNNAERRVESTWAESLGTGISYMTGSFDAEGKVLTLSSEYTGPDGAKGTIKQVTRWTGKDTYTTEFTDAKGVKLMQIEYTRSGSVPKPVGADGTRDTRDEMRAAHEEAKKAMERSKQNPKPAPK